MTNILDHSLDDYFLNSPIGSINKAIGNNLYGFNHQQNPAVLPRNRDSYGLTFFTRPQLNLQSDNIRNDRRFYSLLTESNVSIQRFVRATLDPRLMTGYKFGRVSVPPISAPLVDPLNAFIPILTNNCSSVSGWPDMAVPIFVSKPGRKNQVYIQVDGSAIDLNAYNVECVFDNTKGDPIIYLFYIWLLYMPNVFEGIMLPYIDYIVENMLDYNSRIYRLVLDKQRNQVTKITAASVAIPEGLQLGSHFDFNREKLFNDQNDTVSVRFKCSGYDALDDILMREFNDCVEIFNPMMRDEYRDNNMVMLDRSIIQAFNFRGYPRINTESGNTLEWYVDAEMFNRVTTGMINASLVPEFLNEQEIGD